MFIEDTYEEDLVTFTFMKKDVQLVIPNADTEVRSMLKDEQIYADEMKHEEEEVPNEEPPDHNANKEEGEMAPLDALYPKIRVPTTEEKKQTLHRLLSKTLNTIKEAVQNKAYMGDRNNVQSGEGEIARMDALYPIMRILSDCKKQKIRSRRSAIHVNTYKEEVMTETCKTHMENVNVPDDVADTSSSNDGHEDQRDSCVTGKRGTKDETNRLIVTAITSERGERGA